eukprot:TRINITY_DN3444_c0_g2_i1.p1 TRINITY_DN3444_c0_g2~~TRINITY_DN3444_c0_g2_i1.p1  ORF type:complete len:219 (-),score=5.59 TRINITY_DN3444_c0_g2_i1:39-629(-)
MCNSACEILSQLDCVLSEVDLTTSAMPWSDHVAVVLYLSRRFRSLLLYPPTSCIPHSPHGISEHVVNLHRRFQARDSLGELEAAGALGGTIECVSEQERRSAMADSSVLIVFTWSKHGGTAMERGFDRLWDECNGTKVHVSLPLLLSPEYGFLHAFNGAISRFLPCEDMDVNMDPEDRKRRGQFRKYRMKKVCSNL